MTVAGVYQNFAIDRVVYGKPAAEVLVAEAARLGARRVFLLVSRTLDRETSWVAEMQGRHSAIVTPDHSTGCRRARRVPSVLEAARVRSTRGRRRPDRHVRRRVRHRCRQNVIRPRVKA